MADKPSKRATSAQATVEMAFDKDSRKGTYHRYKIVTPNKAGIVGTIYLPRDRKVADTITIRRQPQA